MYSFKEKKFQESENLYKSLGLDSTPVMTEIKDYKKVLVESI